MKYDDTSLPTGYDRARARSPEVLARWASTVSEHAPRPSAVRTILDLGCGTGRFSGALREQFAAMVIGVDPSSRMLARAGAKWSAPGFRFLRASGEDLPLKDDSVDLIFASMVLHHLEDVPRVVRQCRRVLGPDGGLFLRAGTKERIPSYPTSTHFPASVPIMERTLWSVDRICGVFESAGFARLHAGVVEQTIAPSHAAYAEQLQAGGDSVLARLDAADFAAGLASVRARASSVDPEPVRESIDFLVFG